MISLIFLFKRVIKQYFLRSLIEYCYSILIKTKNCPSYHFQILYVQFELANIIDYSLSYLYPPENLKQLLIFLLSTKSIESIDVKITQ